MLPDRTKYLIFPLFLVILFSALVTLQQCGGGGWGCGVVGSVLLCALRSLLGTVLCCVVVVVVVVVEGLW